MTLKEITQKIKNIIVTRLGLSISADEIADDEYIFTEGLGLDSIDSLEIIIGIEKEFDIKITEEDLEDPEAIFYNMETLAKFVEKKISEK